MTKDNTNRYQHVKNVSKKERVAIANKRAAIEKDRRSKLDFLAAQADHELFYMGDRRRKHHRKEK